MYSGPFIYQAYHMHHRYGVVLIWDSSSNMRSRLMNSHYWLPGYSLASGFGSLITVG